MRTSQSHWRFSSARQPRSPGCTGCPSQTNRWPRRPSGMQPPCPGPHLPGNEHFHVRFTSHCQQQFGPCGVERHQVSLACMHHVLHSIEKGRARDFHGLQDRRGGVGIAAVAETVLQCSGQLEAVSWTSSARAGIDFSRSTLLMSTSLIFLACLERACVPQSLTA